MFRTFFVSTLAMLFAALAPMSAAGQSIEGTWKVTSLRSGVVEDTDAIVKLKVEGGKLVGEVVASSPRSTDAVTLKSVAQEGGKLRIVLDRDNVEIAFEGTLAKDAGKRINGTLSSGGTLYPGWVSITDEKALDKKAPLIDCPPMQRVNALTSKLAQIQTQALITKDVEKRKDLIKQLNEASKAANAEMPGLYREVLAKHAESPAVFEASVAMMRRAQFTQAKPEEVKAWATAGENAAKTFGPRWQMEYYAQVATVLVNQDDFAAMGLDYARQAEKLLTPQSSAGDQARVLGVVARGLRKAGQDGDAKAIDARVTKLDPLLDKEYAETMPPFKVTAFKGRTSKSERAVLLELFTGATCPPCVAADLAFDGLQKAYKPSELVLLQYHMHIPGPDPMTNPDTEARWAYYRTAFGKQVAGVPSSIFNGKPMASGGGGIANAKPKYIAYRKVIDTLLEDNAGAKLAVEANRVGDRVTVAVKVSDVTDPGEKKKLRILLAEETVSYAGSNRIRLHHNVVRAFPGGVGGIALMEAASRHTASVDVGEVRGNLTKYLDDFRKPFANPARPLEMNHLRAIVFVQDDATQEILQAAMVDVKGK